MQRVLPGRLTIHIQRGASIDLLVCVRGDVHGVDAAVPRREVPQLQPPAGDVQADPLPVRGGHQTASGGVQHDVALVEQPSDGPDGRRACRVQVRQTEVGLKSHPSSSHPGEGARSQGCPPGGEGQCWGTAWRIGLVENAYK